MKRPAFTLLIALAAAATTLGAAPAATTATACKTSDLVVWLGPTRDAGAGSSFFTLEFTNQSGHGCTLKGYPGVSALDLHGQRLGSPGSREPSSARVVRLANGATASAGLRIAMAANFRQSVCNRHAAAGLRVYPPNQTASKIVPIPFEVCLRPGPVYLSVKALQA